MGKITLTDAALREAAAAVRQSMLDAIPAEEDCPHEFPPEFEQSLRRQYQQKGKKKTGRPVLRRVAAIFLATLVALGAWLAVDGKARAAVIRWFREVYETRVIYRFTGEQDDAVLPDFELSWIPEGYEQTDLYRNDFSCSVVYEPPGSPADGVGISYNLISEGTALVVDDVDGIPVTVEINGVNGDLYLGTEASPFNVLVWCREDLGIQIDITSKLSPEDILHIASGLNLFISTK